MRDGWDIFNALTCDHPMLADIPEYILPPYSEGDIRKWTNPSQEEPDDNTGQ
jgi:hypothetical protein